MIILEAFTIVLVGSFILYSAYFMTKLIMKVKNDD